MDALIREFKEEVDLTIHAAQPLLEVAHDYGDKCVLLDVWFCSNKDNIKEFSGEAKGNENQQVKWVSINELDNYEFPEANKVIIDKLKNQSLVS